MFLDKLVCMIKAIWHKLINRFLDPILLAEQNVRDLKKDYTLSMNALAQIKSLSIETGTKIAEQKAIAKDYEDKALSYLQKAQSGELSQEDADKLATDALKKKQEIIESIKKNSIEAKNFDSMAENLENKINTLNKQISDMEYEVKTLKARHKAAISSKKLSINRITLSDGSPNAQIENLKGKIKEEEALAKAYDELSMIETSIDREINAAIGTSYPDEVQISLNDLKKQLNENYLLSDKKENENE